MGNRIQASFIVGNEGGGNAERVTWGEIISLKMLQREARETFDRVNQQRFNGELRRKYEIVFSKRMKTTQGTASPQKKIIFLSMAEIEKSDWEAVEKTLKHEMVHCWLYKKPETLGS